MSKIPRSLVIMAAVMAACLAVASSATAQIVVGQVAPGVSPPAECEYSLPYDEFQSSVASGPSYVVPAAGVLTSWSTNASAGAGQTLGLKVFRPLGASVFQVVGHDGPRPLVPGVLNTFPVGIPVLPGDIVGLAVPISDPGSGGVPSACLFTTGSVLDVINYRQGLAPDGTVLTPEESFSGNRLNVSTTLLPPPAISGISPAKGSVKGGAAVVITGANFASVTGVSFGSVAAASFTVGSEGQITATAPPSATLVKVPVTVTTAAGAASSAQTFAYEGCKVPKLGGKKLKPAKKKLKKADCKLGKVKLTGDATKKTGKVTKQNPKPGKILAPGAKVGVKLG